MKYSLDYDFTVQVRGQEGEEDQQFARFYQGIYSVTLNTFVDVMFVPSFCREVKGWSLHLPFNVNEVHSAQEARLFTAALSDLIVTPDDYRAGEEELIPPPPSPPPYTHIAPEMGVIFYVTPQQFALFSQELAEIEQETFSLYPTVPVSKIAHFACIKFITEKIMTSPYFSEENLRILGRQKERPNRGHTNHTHNVNRSPVYQNRKGRDRKDKEARHAKEARRAVVRGEAKALHSYG